MHHGTSSKPESKRTHHWFMDAIAPEVFSNKKQAIQSVESRSLLGIADTNVSPWHNASSFQSVSGQFGDSLFESEPMRTVNLVDRNISSVDSRNMNMGRKDFEDQCINSSSVGLSLSPTVEDAPCLSFGGIRKVKVNQAKDSNNAMPTSAGHPYNIGVNSIASMPTVYNASFISMGHTFNKRDADFISVGHNYDKGNESILSMGQPFDKEDVNFFSMGQPFDKEDDTVQPPYHSAECNITTMAPAQCKGESGILSMHQNYNKGGSNTISFGGFFDESETNSPGSIISGYDLLLNNQNSVQASELPSQQQLVPSNPELNVNSAPTSIPGTATNSKHKEPKTTRKVSLNNFPSNVKSLLSTGMLDGVAVKYVSWSREKNLKAYIQGTGYMCGCKDCKFEKALNAYEFERHANCKTKHPNTHIYFENGKTIYAVVQELKNTPHEMLFDVIQKYDRVSD
ncbi:Detected protein of unknown function [Hibiscus syriacus]|uniref:Tify domain-containing protein n=1 Tax=Hibiscus syriacus TaxID=106335 RepID=A0A6A3AFJ0_HIBSY|nr:Detected protein of unknown function [Hibiscus syriacus]